jgi:hypothetical protein
MRGRKQRGGVACSIGVLLNMSSSGSGSVVATGASLAKRCSRVNENVRREAR